jgi:hypothetical protein
MSGEVLLDPVVVTVRGHVATALRADGFKSWASFVLRGYADKDTIMRVAVACYREGREAVEELEDDAQ